jgi:hypothetical protein
MIQHLRCAAQGVRPFLLPLLIAASGCGDGPAPDARPASDAGDTAVARPPGPSTARPSGPAQVPVRAGDSTAEPTMEPDTSGNWTARDTRVTNAVAGVATLLAVRTAAHPAFDRLVFEFDATEVPSYRIEYIDRPVHQCGSGEVVPLAGDAWLRIQFEPANAHTEQGQPTVTERSRSPRLPNLLELKLICDFEAVIEWIAAVRSPEPYRVVVLRSPTRLIVDLRHARR